MSNQMLNGAVLLLLFMLPSVPEQAGCHTHRSAFSPCLCMGWEQFDFREEQPPFPPGD